MISTKPLRTRREPSLRHSSLAHDLAPSGGLGGWIATSTGTLRKTFPFPTAAQVLRFAVQAEELTQAAAAEAEIQQRFGEVTVVLSTANGRGVTLQLTCALNRTAAAVAQRGVPHGVRHYA